MPEWDNMGLFYHNLLGDGYLILAAQNSVVQLLVYVLTSTNRWSSGMG